MEKLDCEFNFDAFKIISPHCGTLDLALFSKAFLTSFFTQMSELITIYLESFGSSCFHSSGIDSECREGGQHWVSLSLFAKRKL
jgi:hypothetical protein